MPVKNCVGRDACARPSAPTTTASPSSARKAAGQSAAGSACTRLPPIVPRLRTCTSPIEPAVSRIACTSSNARGRGSARVRACGRRSRSRRASRRCPRARACGPGRPAPTAAARRCFSAGIRLMPPPSSFASGVAPAAPASFSVRGAKYSKFSGIIASPPRDARHTRSALSGMSMCFTPRGRSASSTAETKHGVEPIVPSSPMPFAPSGFRCVGVQVESSSMRGNMWRLGHGVVHQRGGQELAALVVATSSHMAWPSPWMMPPSRWPSASSGFTILPASSTARSA